MQFQVGVYEAMKQYCMKTADERDESQLAIVLHISRSVLLFAIWSKAELQG